MDSSQTPPENGMTFPLPHGHAIRITADSERTISTVHTALAESPTWRPPPTPRMITVEEHEQSLARERDRHEAVVRRMGSEIVRLKAAVKAAKDSAKEVKRKAQEELREAVKEARHNYAAAGTRKRARAPGNKHEVKWQTRFEELTAYKELHGHCNVEKHEGNKDLRQWCQTQRTMYSKLVHGQETSMTSERLRLLNSLRFQWVRKMTESLKWDDRFGQLKQFKEKHGHVRIPQKLDDPAGLGNWVLEQRRRQREMFLTESERKSGKGPLSLEQVEKMESLGFEWSLRKRTGGK